MHDESAVAECLILQPVNITLVVKRNLSVTWYHTVPDIDVLAHLESFSVSEIKVYEYQLPTSIRVVS